MSTAFAFIGREALMLVLLAGLGSGATAFLGSRFDGTSRVALSPVLGLCIGTGICTTLIWVFPASKTYWLVPALAIGSVTIARVRRGHRGGSTRPPRMRLLVDIIQILVVVIAVAGPITYVFAVRQSVGPVGYDVGDAQGYVATIDGAQRESLQETDRIQAATPEFLWSNITQKYWSNYGHGIQELDATPFTANVDELLGLWGTDTQSPFLLAYLVAGALAALAVVRCIARRATFAAPLAGILFGGSLFLQLYFDGSEAAIIGLGVLAPLALFGFEALRSPRPANLILFALLASGLVAFYPLFLPAVGITTLIGSLAASAWYVREHGYSHRALLMTIWRIAVVVACVCVFDIVAFRRTASYLMSVLHGSYGSGGLPSYSFLTAGVVPSWVVQIRQFYDLSQPASPLLGKVFLTLALPVIVGVVAATSLRRHAEAWLLLSLAAAAAVLGLYESAGNSCTYCEERNLLPIAPVVAVLFALGVAGLLGSRLPYLRGGGVAIAALALAGVGPSAYGSIMRFRDRAYFLDSSVRIAIDHLPAKGDVDLEGFGQSYNPSVELGLVYMLAEEKAWSRVSLPADYNDDGSLIYLGGGGLPLNGPQFRPGYQYVLTTLAGVETSDRRILYRNGPVALERRTAPLDVTLDYGEFLPYTRFDPRGIPELNPYNPEPLKLIVVGQASRTVYLSLRFYVSSGTRTVAVEPADGTTAPGFAAWSTAHRLAVCVVATGTSTIRSALVRVLPLQGVELTAMRGSTTSCLHSSRSIGAGVQR